MTDREALAQVERLIDDCKNRIGRQREVVASAFQEGHDTDIATSMLRAFERHRQYILNRQQAKRR
jgi:hypothetical protein